ncbi:MAG: ATP-binding protein [Candidatus Omnitrophota bacterium]
MLPIFFIKNLDVVFFIYGLSFVVTGVAILVHPRSQDSLFRLSGIIWLLAEFGLSHGMNEWLDMFAIIRSSSSELFDQVRLILLTISYLFLFEFGRRFVGLSFKKFLPNQVSTVILSFLVLVLINIPECDQSIWPRYFLGLPGGLLTGTGFIFYYRGNQAILRPLHVRRYFVMAAFTTIIYAVLGGLVVPKANFFPAFLINTTSFLNFVGIPVQVFRAICSVILAVCVWSILNIFNWEIKRRLEDSLEEEKKVAAAVAVAETERAKAEELAKAYKRLEDMQNMLIQAEKIKAVGQLASGVAHEIRNPLAIIVQGADFLNNRITPKEKDVAEVIQMIEDNVGKADRIVSTLLDFSKATRLTLKAEDINAILDNSLLLVQHEVKGKNVGIIKELAGELPEVSADKEKMEQVFINLFMNAVQAMPNGGKIFIRSCLTQLDTPGNGVGIRSGDSFKLGERVIMVEIEDTGEGISKENIKKIFDPFFTTKGPKMGTGLGLSVTRNIITMHRGLINFDSYEGKGTKVMITLRIQE